MSHVGWIYENSPHEQRLIAFSPNNHLIRIRVLTNLSYVQDGLMVCPSDLPV